jgi:CRISPR-associated protein Cas1
MTASPSGETDVLVPARMVNEWLYCPRLAYMEWIDGEWADSAETVDGRRVHRRVDQETGDLVADEPLPEEGEVVARSVLLSSPADRLIARLDLVESAGGASVRPVDYKRGRPPEIPDGAHLPERAQIAAQVLVLRANGHPSDHGFVYFAESKQRVKVTVDDTLLDAVHSAVDELLAARAAGRRPPPLVDSPKCIGCSLAPLCLPDEINLLTRPHDAGPPPAPDGLRRLVPARDDAIPLHVNRQGAYIAKRGEELEIRAEGGLLGKARLPGTSHVALYGNISISTPVVRELLSREIPVAYHSMGGWYFGQTNGFSTHALEVRRAQYRAADDAERKQRLAVRFVITKLENQRTLLRRNHDPAPEAALSAISRAVSHARAATTLDTLRGAEGEGAAVYFSHFDGMLRPPKPDAPGAGAARFQFERRSRRPPADPVNAMLSFAYALLVRECTAALLAVGLDPMLGYLHEPRAGRPALALDLMEEFRPVLADSVVLTLVNTGEIERHHFVSHGPAWNLTEIGRKLFLRAWERRMDVLVTHPVFGYRISYRRTLEVQARLLGRHLAGEIESFPPFRVR